MTVRTGETFNDRADTVPPMKGILSSALDATVVPGFSRIGYAVRSRLGNWSTPEWFDMHGKVVVITGPTSGLGKEAAHMLAATGATMVLVGRNADKCASLVGDMRRQFPDTTFDVVIADMGDLESVARASREILARHAGIDVLVHNAGALLNTRTLCPQGLEATVASHVVGPHLMTRILVPALRQARGRVVTVSSGGMYAMVLPRIVGGRTLEMGEHNYDGTKQYAIAKRAQVTLNEMWAVREPDVTFLAMHPGWADTPGVQESIPGFRKVTRPILRTPREGADTIAWLAAVPEVPGASGTFWCDREQRSIHKIPSTRRSDTAEARANLWEWCLSVTAPWAG